jgi:site-specific DNA-methyltransferase (adenine-specific)
MNNTLPDKSVQLIIADPPYFETKGHFDFVWNSFDEYLTDVERWAKECKRVLAENGTLFWFGSSKRIAYAQIIFDKYFYLVNNLTWEKAEADGLFGSTGSEQLRSFPNSTERILMYSNEVERTGLEVIKLDMDNFQTLRKYFKDLQEWIGVGLKKINEKLGHRKAEHGFYHSSTQWDLPTIETYNELIQHYEIDKWSNYKEYEALRQEYEALRQEYEALRRPFHNFYKSTEILKARFTPSEYDHETVKPEKLARMLIKTCSRENDLVFVPFAGSGTECAMAIKEGRNAIGFDTELKYVEMGNQRMDLIKQQPSLFF